MASELTKMIMVPVDGSETALRSLDYLQLLYGSRHNLEVMLFYVLPSLPAILADEGARDRETAVKLKAIENKNLRIGERILAEAKDFLLQRGFEEERIKTAARKKELEVARDICSVAESKRADAILITTRGRSRLEAFFMGEISGKLLDYCRICPVWIVEGAVSSKKVLLCMDSSENSLRAADHAAFMLSGTDCQVTIFHSMRHLRRFVPLEALQEAPELEELWKHRAGQEIAPALKKAKEMLLKAGLSEDQVSTKVVDGSRSAANDILEEASSSGCGTLVLGRRGLTGVQEFFMGSVSRKVLENCKAMAFWIVQ